MKLTLDRPDLSPLLWNVIYNGILRTMPD